MVVSTPRLTSSSLVAHRGHARRFPENTLPALRDAAALGFMHVEFDLQLTRDQFPVLLHDASLARTVGDPRDVRDLELEELRRLSAHEPTRLGDRHRGTPIPTLDEVVAWARTQPGLRCFPEIKEESIARFGRATVAARVLGGLAPLRARCVVLSFDAEVLRLSRDAGFTIGWCPPDASARSRDLAATLAPEFLFGDVKDFAGTDPLWPGDWAWAVYEVEDAATARRFVARGARYLETMAVADLLAELDA